MDSKKLIDFNSSSQNDLILLNVIQKNDFQHLITLVKEQNYPVTPFVLNCLVAFKQAFRINALLCEAQNLEVSVYDWLVLYWGKEDTDKFCCDHNINIDMQRISSSKLVQARKWDVLLKREDYDALLKAEQYQLLIDNHKLRELCQTAGGRRVLSEMDTIESLYCLSILASIPVDERKQYWKRLIDHNPSERQVQGAFYLLRYMGLKKDLVDFVKVMIPQYGSVLTDCAEGALILYELGKYEELNEYGWACVVRNSERQQIGDVISKAIEYGKLPKMGAYTDEREKIMKSSAAKIYIRKLEQDENWDALKKYQSYLLRKGFFKLWWKVRKLN